MEFWPYYLALGAFVGFLAGLLGIGGGLTMVPVLTILFTAQNFPASHVLHLALGTAMASIFFTSLSSVRAHHSHNAVEWGIVKSITPGVVAGTLLGTFLARGIPSKSLAVVFAIFAYYAAVTMFIDIKPKPSRGLPGTAGMWLVGGAIGGVSSLLAAGGAFLSVPFMVMCNVRVHKAIGTSAAIGFPIAAAGAIGYITAGLTVSALPQHTLGFVYLPALIGLVIASMTLAPFGARLAHRLPVPNLKKVFAALLFILATKMLTTLL